MNKHHYSGLTDAQVLESRKKNGANILTPPAEETMWEKIKNCMHFWLLKVDLAIFVISALAATILPITSIYDHAGLWIAPVLSFILFFLTYLVAYLGGEWKEEEGEFDIDSLFTILLFALLLSGAIAFYNGVYGGVEGWAPYLELIGIAAAVLLATAVAHILEAQNEKTFQSLNEVNDDTLVKVIRKNNVCQVPRKDIVVGDIILLEAGEEVPADAELLNCMNLMMNESSLTGEPQCAKTTNLDEFDKDATYPSNHIMKGCTVMEGDCVAKVFAVGDATACGKVFEAAQVQDGEATPLSEKLDELAGLITKTSYGLAILIVLGRLVRHALLLPDPNYGSLTGYLVGSLALALLVFFGLNKKKNEDNEESLELWQVLAFMILPIIGIILYFAVGTAGATNWPQFIQYALDSVMIAVTLIVVAVPEGLPMAVTLSLAFSMKRLMKQNTLPRTMHACETMGAVSVICSDKTGTLTQNQMKVVGTAFSGLEEQKLGTDKVSSLLKECIAINTTANLDMADTKKIKAIGNPTEGALLLWLHTNGVNYLDIRESLIVVDRIQFTTELKYMATLVKSEVVGKRVVYVKGAPDILMNMCKMTSEDEEFFNNKLADYQSHANRTLAFAYKELNDSDDVFTDGKLNINDLCMMGIVGIEDPVRTDVPAAIEDCLNAGIQVKIVTGDAPGTAKEIGRQLGLWEVGDTDDNILIGTDLAAMPDEELKNRLPKVKIISRARPNDKERIVRLLKDLDYIVAVTGDGTNDAPALNAANVGLSMGDGTAVAKEASDMTIIDNSFSTIANAVMWGRSLYKNIKRFILFQMTVNVAACLIVLIGAFIGEESPLTVTQMLWVNLIMDTFAALALASLPPTKTVMKEKPRSVNEHILNGMGLGVLGVGGLFTIILLGICIFFQHTDVTSLMDVFSGSVIWGENHGLSAYELGLFFTIFVMLQFWNLFNAKAFLTSSSAFNGISWKNTKWFILIALVILIGQIIMTEIPGLQEMFNVAEGGIKPIDWVIIIGMTSLVLWIGELVRLVSKYIRTSYGKY
ncbi:MAG: HAD-IC family P-type ATPase [Bacteroidia bacterium]|nr:HAD-IC family P-type ATPase [Bacteroidia bacterium]